MQTPKLVAVERPNSRFVVRVNGPRLGTFETLPDPGNGAEHGRREEQLLFAAAAT